MSDTKLFVNCRDLKIPLCLNCFIPTPPAPCYLARYARWITDSVSRNSEEQPVRIYLASLYKDAVKTKSRTTNYPYYFKEAIRIYAPEYLKELDKWAVLL
jgi:hypothetical protein